MCAFLSSFMLETSLMRTLNLHLPDDALPTCAIFWQPTQEARGFRRAPAVRDVGKGQRLPTVSETWSFPSAARRTWVPRLAHQGTPGLVDRPRPGRPPHVTCALAPHLQRLVAHDPLEPGALHAPWRGRARATVFARATGVHLGRARVRGG